MKALLQRVLSASVAVEGDVVGAIERGYVVLLGVAPDDGDAQIDWLVDKVLGLRVFANEQGKLDYDLGQIGGSVLLVSQFTLLADTQRGRRPSFSGAAPAHAERIYNTVALGLPRRCRANWSLRCRHASESNKRWAVHAFTGT